MEGEKKTKYIAGAVVFTVLVFWLFSGDSATPRGNETEDETTTAVSAPVVAPALKKTSEEERGEILQKKTEILTRVRSQTPLTSKEKEEIGGIMLTKGYLYNFTAGEREVIFSALQR